MTVATIISKTDLARRTRQIVNQARRGGAVIVESYGEEQVAILDAADYRCLRAVAAYYAWPQQPSPVTDSSLAPRGLDADEVQQAVVAAEGDAQAAWNRVLKAYLDGDISLGRAAQLLELSRFELLERMTRLGLPSPVNPERLLTALTRAQAGTTEPQSLDELRREVGLDDDAPPTRRPDLGGRGIRRRTGS